MTSNAIRSLIGGFLAGSFTLAAFYNGPGESLPHLVYSTALILIPASILLLKSSHRRWGRAEFILVAYIIWMAVSVQWSSLVENSFYYFWILSSLPLVSLVVRQLEPMDWTRILWYMLIPLSFSALWGIGEFVITMQRANGPLIDPNAWAALNNIFFFVVLSQYLIDKKRSYATMRLLEGLMFLFAVALFCAYSRGATVVWLAAFSFVVLIAWLGRLDRKKILTVILISALGFSIVHGYVSQSDASHDEGYTLNIEDAAWSQRFVFWNAAWKIYLDHPYTGSGLATFKVLYPVYRTPGDLTNTGNFVHNDYLQFLQEGGPVQLLFLLGLVLYLISRLIAGARSVIGSGGPTSGGPASRGTAPEMLILVVAAGTPFAHGLINFTLFLLPTQMMVGFILARILFLAGNEKPVLQERKLAKPVLALLLATVWGSWTVLALDGVAFALIYEHRGIPFINWVKKDPVRYFDTIHWLAHNRSGNSSNHFALATLYRKTMDKQSDPAAIRSLAIAAAAEYRIGLQQNPYRYAIQIYYADLLEYNPEIYAEFPDEDQPVQILHRALDLNPIYIRLYTELARHYKNSGNSETAYELLKDQAWPWLDLHYNDFEIFQTRYLQMLRRLAVEFDDSEMLSLLDARTEA
ncbi:MAG: O-antigen ligase family protein [Gammaproteobacteria bacterium]|nr:O-antigen ligase family protein [Gammaproteobacteria bacterium]